METRRKRTLAYELMLDVAAVPLAERAHIMLGAEQFFAHGWPINHFTVGMAARAGMGLVPSHLRRTRERRPLFSSYETRADAVRVTYQHIISP